MREGREEVGRGASWERKAQARRGADAQGLFGTWSSPSR